MEENAAGKNSRECGPPKRDSTTTQNRTRTSAALTFLSTLILFAGCNTAHQKLPKNALAPVTLSCAIGPSSSTFPGDPLIITATAGSLDPTLTTTYTWSGPGVTGNGNTATVATGSLSQGTYTATATVTETRPSEPTPKLNHTATCSASFTVRDFESPTLNCIANPTDLQPGETSTITAVGVSPQNRPLTYTYSTTSGSISGDGYTATYSSAGAPTGAVGITCNVSDDKGHTVTANTIVTIIQALVGSPRPPVCAATVCRGYALLHVISPQLSPGDQVTWSFLEDPTRLEQGSGTGKIETSGLPNGPHVFQGQLRKGAEAAQCQSSFETGPPPTQCDQSGDLSWVVAMLPPGLHEHFGFKMHIYVLARKRPQTKDEIDRLHNIVRSVLGRGDVVAENNALAPQPANITPNAVPTPAQAAAEVSAEKKGEIAIPVIEPFPGCGDSPPMLKDCTDDGKATWVVEDGKYDPSGAVDLIKGLSCEQPNASPTCRPVFAGDGPFLVATLNTLSFSPGDNQNYRLHPRPLLIWDLSGNSPQEADSWTDKFVGLSSDPANWSGNTIQTRIQTMALKLAGYGFVGEKVGQASAMFFKITGIKQPK
jgi:hypothetical protein